MKSLVLLAIVVVLSSIAAIAQISVGNSQLSFSFNNLAVGVEISSIMDDGTELLMGNSEIFFLDILNMQTGTNETLTSDDDWGSISVNNTGSNCTFVFANSLLVNVPDSLVVTVTVDVNNANSQWDIDVTGIGADYSLIKSYFPYFKIKAPGNDYFLVPKYSGKAFPNPLANAIDYELTYPRGWQATLPFMSYYNDNYGVYLAYHDPDASVKKFIIKAQNNYIEYYSEIIIPDESKSNNNWELPGVFELDVFTGDWFDAAMIYREWASVNANYWPEMTSERIMRQNEIGRIGAWGYFSSDTSYAMSNIQNQMSSFINYFNDVPTGIHWYRWNYLDFDDDYPNYFPERAGMTNLVNNIQQLGNAYIMPYINGRLYDTDLPDYMINGYPYATKHSNGDIYYQNFNGNHFAVMCPTQQPWQNILIDATKQLTDNIDCSSIYIDQVCAAGPAECMDTTHNHTLGGGHFWRDGYSQMFARIRDTIPSGKFVTVEGGTDYLADGVDGFLTEGWTSDYLVPAFQAVYGGKVQFFGTSTGTSTYNNQSFYCKLSQALVYGIQPGRFSLWLIFDPNATLARPFVRNIATMRYKLRNYLSFGVMQRPVSVNDTMPEITSTWYDYGSPVDVTISALQIGTYLNISNDSIAIIFSNSSMTDSMSFSFDFDGSTYGFSGQLYVQQITETINGMVETQSNIFTKSLAVPPITTIAYLISSDFIVSTDELDEQSFIIYPNPSNEKVFVESKLPCNYKIFDARGKLIQRGILIKGQSIIDFSNYKSGVYIIRTDSGESKKIVIY